jgi:hypothetical protein
MPVTTRSMTKSNNNVDGDVKSLTPKQKRNHDMYMLIHRSIFVDNQQRLLDNLHKAIGKEAKMIIALDIYKHINGNFAPLLNTLNPEFISFAATVYNKTTEFYRQLIEGIYDEISKILVDTFTKEFMTTRTFLMYNLINLKKTNPLLIDMNNQHIRDAYNNIEAKIKACDNKEPSFIDMNNPRIKEAYNNIEEKNKKNNNINQRPPRNISRVDYTGM